MKVLKRRHLLVLALLMASCDPMQHTKCDDALVKQVASPDRDARNPDLQPELCGRHRALDVCGRP